MADKWEEMTVSDVEVTPEYERQFERELTTAGSFVPVKGIRGLGWRGWQNLPAADLVKDLIDWHVGFMREHVDLPYYLFFHKMIEKGELTLDELRSYYSNYYSFVNNMFPWEGYVTAQLQERIRVERNDPEGIREARDLFRAHFYEEAGHEELLADYCKNALGLDKVKDLYIPALKTEENYLKTNHDFFKIIYRDHHFTEAAVLMFAERDLPRPHRRVRKGLKAQYGFGNKDIIYFDVHSYIDIYHERYGQYLIAKHATSKELQENVSKLFKQIMETRLESEKRFYSTLKASRR